MTTAYNPSKALIETQDIPPVIGTNTPAYNQQNDSTLNINTPPDSEPTFSVSEQDANTAAIPSDDVIKQRAFKAQYGLYDILKKSQQEIFQDIYNGNENSLREGAAAEVDFRRQKVTQEAVAKYAANKGGPLSIDEYRNLSSMISQLDNKTDPSSIIEQAFAKHWVSSLDTKSDSNSVLSDANKENPEAVARLMSSGEELMAKREYLLKLKQDLEADLKDQSWIGWGVDQAKFFIPGYEDLKMRGNIPGVGMLEGLSKAGNLEEQHNKLLRLPFDNNYREQINTAVDNLRKDNPTAAMNFLNAMIGMTSGEALMYNLGTLADATTLPIGKVALKAGKLAEVVGSSTKLKDVEKAVGDVVKASTAPEVSPSTVLDGVGNLKEAAIAKTTASKTAEQQGLPQVTKDSIQSLKSTFRTDIDNIKQNPGGASQELVNRIAENSQHMFDRFIDTITKGQKVERLPDILDNETAIRGIVDATKDNYPWMRNTVLDTSPVYQDPIANRRFIDYIIGKTDGTYFAQRSVAENFIKTHGLRDASIEAGTEVRFSKDYRRKDLLERNIQKNQEAITKREAELADPKSTDKVKVYAQEQIDGLTDFLEKYRKELREVEERIGLSNKVSVEQQGLGYYIKITKPLRETDDAIRDSMAMTKDTQMPPSLLNTFVGKIRTPEEVLSKADRQNRLAVTYSRSNFENLIVDAAKDIRDIKVSRYALKRNSKKKWQEFQRVLINAQEILDDQGRKGRWFESPQELETYYRQWIKRAPDEQEISAYFSFKNISEMDRQFRNIAEVRNQSRAGAETQRIFTYDKAGNKVYSPEFSGIERKTLPRNDDNVLIMGDSVGEETVKQLNKMNTRNLEEYSDQIKRGELRLIELYYPERYPLEGEFANVGDKRVRYVITKNLETRELDWNQIPRRGGGHVEYDYPFYLKQADIRHDGVADAWWYNGDRTFAPISNRAMGQDIAKKMNHVIDLLASKKIDEAREYSNQYLHIDWNDLYAMFQPYRGADGKMKPPMLSTREHIQVVPKNARIGDIDASLSKRYGTNFRDSSREGSIGSQYQVQFSGERDADNIFTFRNQGTQHNPIYSVEPAAVVDPIASMNRAVSRIAGSNMMDDYKIFSIEHWLRQAEPYLDYNNLSEVRYAPHHWFNDPKYRKGIDQGIVRQLEAARLHIQTFAGMSSNTRAYLDSVNQKMVDSVYNKFGPKAAELTQTWAIPALTDPFQFMRSVVFHEKLGLFNIPQLIVQAANYTNILGIAGLKHGTAGTYAAQLHFWSQANSKPQILAKLDSMATKLNLPGAYNWKPGEFLEARNELMKTGFGNVGGEYAALDILNNDKVIPSAVGSFLDWGSTFFKLGEQNARLGAWYTAFAEFKSANPLVKITNKERAQILQRADLLNINMSRASSSQVHQGIWSVPTQFYTYQLRLFELFTGSLFGGGRLTRTEAAKLFTTNAAFYGFPMAAGLTGWPVADIIRQKMIENGYNPGDKYVSSIMMEGIPSFIGALATGEGDTRKGTFYDFGNRFGTKGFDFINSFSRTDKNVLDIFGGASYSVLKGTWEQSDGLRMVLGSLLRRDGQMFPFKVEDFVDLFKEISSVNTFSRTLMAINFNVWLSKRDQVLTDTSKANAIFAAITGLKDQRINDIQTKSTSIREQKDAQKYIEKSFLQEFRRAILAQKSNNPEQAKQFFTRSQNLLVILGYPEDKISSLLNKAVRDNETTLERINFDFYLKYAPDSQKDVRYKTYQQILKNQDNKENQ